MMEMTKLLPSLLLKYDFSPLPRSSGSPHLRGVGRGCDGVEREEEAIWLDSSWFFEASVSSRFFIG